MDKRYLMKGPEVPWWEKVLNALAEIYKGPRVPELDEGAKESPYKAEPKQRKPRHLRLVR